MPDQDIPEPFRYSRAHSYPASAAPQRTPATGPASDGGGPRRRVVLGLIAAVTVLLLLGILGIPRLFGGDDTTIAQPGDPSAAPQEPEGFDEPGDLDDSGGSLPGNAFATELPEAPLPPGWVEEARPPERKTTPSQAPATEAPAPPRADPPKAPPSPPLPDLLLTGAALGGVDPGSWGVFRERLHPQAGSRPAILSCDQSVDVPPHLARVFLVPDGSDPSYPWRRGNLDIVQRLGQYADGQGAQAVSDIRAMHRRCPVRQRNGYSERWETMTDTRTATGDVLWYRRLLNSPDPTGVDRGSDWFVVRHRDVVTLVEMRHGRAAPGPAGSNLLTAIRGTLCPAGSC